MRRGRSTGRTALTAYAATDWAGAAAHAKASYDHVLNAAAAAGVNIEPHAPSADYKSHGKSFMAVDPVSYNRNLP